MELSRLKEIVSAWYSLNPDVRRLWVYEAGATHSGDARDIHVIVSLTPVGDSDDITPIWLARRSGWQRHLETLTESRVHLRCTEIETDQEACTEDPQHARVCVAHVAWRDSTVPLRSWSPELT